MRGEVKSHVVIFSGVAVSDVEKVACRYAKVDKLR
jgi:hypothetical protein